MSTDQQEASGAEGSVELRAKTKVRREADRLLEDEYGLEVGAPVMPPKMPKPSGAAQVDLKANLFPLKTEKDTTIYRWDVEMVIDLRNGKKLSVTKKSYSDSVAVDRKRKARLIFKHMVSQNPEIFGELQENFYDLESTLYTLSDVRSHGEDQLCVVVGGLDAVVFRGTTSASVIVKKVADHFQLSLVDFAHLTSDVGKADQSHKQFLEVATSQAVLMSEDHVCYPGGLSFNVREDTSPLPEGKYLGHGVHKSVHYIEGAGEKPCAAIAIDVRKTSFHSEVTALNYLMSQSPTIKQDIQQGQKLKASDRVVFRKLKGLRCVLDYAQDKRREIVVHDVVPQCADEVFFETQNGEKKTVSQYFVERYRIKLHFPSAPLAVEKKAGTLSYYPLELIRVVENQRVQGDLSRAVTGELVRKAAILPADRIQQITNAFDDLQLRDNHYLEKVATTVDSQMLPLKGRRIKDPVLVFGGKKEQARRGIWTTPGRGPHFVQPARLLRWTCMMISVHSHAQTIMRDFLLKFEQECKKRGMHVGVPKKPQILRGQDFKAEMDMFMEETVKRSHVDFILCIQDNEFHFHKSLKFLERKHGVITQDLTTSTVRRCLDKSASATLENIVQKTNVKLGGLNYGLEMKSPSGKFDVLDPETMFVGLGMCHSKMPRPDTTGREPPRPASVVGFAANVLAQSFAFIGDYYYQMADRDEQFFSIVSIVTGLLTQWCKHHGGQMPKHIVFFRNGGSAGQFAMILKYEVPLIRFAIHEYQKKVAGQAQANTKFCLLIATKRHNIRFFKSNMDHRGRASEQNLDPGIAIDSTVTHPVFPEFFVNTHTTLQGTGRTARYTVLHNSSEFKITQLEHYVVALSHAHQIVNITTSLPTPAYIASQYAERGMNVLHQFLSENADVSGDAYDTFNEKLTYAAMQEDSMFHHCRVNA